ncbi:hypothetical protein LAJ19_08485 [Deinococcus taeanensis]|uniref:hypothetical protein n=1 Tax=Deinococcus taeanensis TaxID=2737050 RepID=UPI001CDC7E59|nr:hypothetical protein [Deinococcus taeanensis]UBV41688.1 hypothetical protein LAJ19_08485 [Deinococcus taeanensis]
MLRRSTLPFLFVLTGLTVAQTAAPLVLRLEQALVETVQTGDKVTERRQPAPVTVQPGNVLEQTVTATNTTRRTLRGVAVNLPVPAGTTFTGDAVLGSARWTATFSADGGRTYARAPLTERLTVTENGRAMTKDVVIPPTRYTNARWTITTMNPDETLKFSLRVKVK